MIDSTKIKQKQKLKNYQRWKELRKLLRLIQKKRNQKQMKQNKSYQFNKRRKKKLKMKLNSQSQLKLANKVR